jgi:DNA-binding MarR family transcriptional regulator
VHPASVTNVVDRLERKGLVVRAPHSSDRRATLAVITDPGRSLADVATLRLNEEVFGAVGVGNQKVESLVELITELRFLAGDFSAAPTTGSPAGPTRESRDTPPDNRENVH